ncbi:MULTISPECIES: hypothetical protein [Shewanella]|uniref:hypothetical protein n=1 Tax=Shewanella TaxID=22 RepID=UPI00257AC98B|nr:hypothetical protein [Shewanella sp.]
MKWIGILCGLLGSLPVAAAEGEYFSEEIVQQGTLANETLLRDAMPGVAAEVARRGCEVPEQFFAFVLAMPKGKVGERYWHERWIVEGCEREYPVDIEFREDGVNAAYWTIKNKG